MNRVLHISPTLTLPLDSVTQTFAILGIRGSGKTNTGTVMFEEMLRLNQQACVIDPVNAWYGVRSSKDGKSAGYKVIVMGGENGDLPLEGYNGPVLADFVVDSGASVIFSLRHLSMAEQRTFAQGFAERLYNLKGKSANRTPLHLFIDEADEFIPQRIPHGFERMFGAFDRLVRRGRSSGIGLTMISQRPQVLNKDTLSQCETLICHRLLHQLDRRAVEAWIMAHADTDKALEFWNTLATLSKGDAWIWSPEWADIFERVHIRERQTFDSSFTPKAGERARSAAKLAAVDLEALKAKLANTIAKAIADDPVVLKKQVADLKRELASRNTTSAAAVKQVRVEVPTPIVPPEVRREFVKLHHDLEAAIGRVALLSQAISKYPDEVQKVIGTVNAAHAIDFKPRSPGISTSVGNPVDTKLRVPVNGSGKLRAGAERMLTALVQWSPQGMVLGQMRSHAGMKKSGTFASYMSMLRAGQYIEERNGLLYATQSGIDYFGGSVPDAPRTTEDVLSVWKPKLRDGARRMLLVLVEHKGESIPLDQLASESNMVRSGTFASYLSMLRTARLITTERGSVSANKGTLFL